MTIREQKSTLRSEVRARRRALSPQERERLSALITAHLALWLEDRAPAGSTVALFLASPAEANLDALIEPLQSRQVRVVAPRGEGFALVGSPSTCRAREGQTWREAEGEPIGTDEIHTALMPGVSFGRDGSRLGQGGGWYDRALQNSRAIRVGVAFECQIVDALPTEEHDLKVQWVVTEESVRRVK